MKVFSAFSLTCFRVRIAQYLWAGGKPDALLRFRRYAAVSDRIIAQVGHEPGNQ